MYIKMRQAVIKSYMFNLKVNFGPLNWYLIEMFHSVIDCERAYYNIVSHIFISLKKRN